MYIKVQAIENKVTRCKVAGDILTDFFFLNFIYKKCFNIFFKYFSITLLSLLLFNQNGQFLGTPSKTDSNECIATSTAIKYIQKNPWKIVGITCFFETIIIKKTKVQKKFDCCWNYYLVEKELKKDVLKTLLNYLLRLYCDGQLKHMVWVSILKWVAFIAHQLNLANWYQKFNIVLPTFNLVFPIPEC